MPIDPQGFKAEIILAIQLVTRHRAPRLAAALGGIALLAARLSGHPAPEPVWAVAGVIGAVAGSRLVCPGAALDSARGAAVPGRAVIGRFLGAVLVVAPIAVAGAGVAGSGRVGVSPEAVVAVGYGATLTSVVMGASSVLGASAGAAVGLAAAWAGQIGPEAWAGAGGPSESLGLIWRGLPLAWRATALREGDPASALVLAGWTAAGLLAAWITTVRGGGRR